MLNCFDYLNFTIAPEILHEKLIFLFIFGFIPDIFSHKIHQKRRCPSFSESLEGIVAKNFHGVPSPDPKAPGFSGAAYAPLAICHHIIGQCLVSTDQCETCVRI